MKVESTRKRLGKLKVGSARGNAIGDCVGRWVRVEDSALSRAAGVDIWVGVEWEGVGGCEGLRCPRHPAKAAVLTRWGELDGSESSAPMVAGGGVRRGR